MLKALEAECVIFDLDGTLVDTAPDLLNTLNALFIRQGRREIALSEIRGIIGLGARRMIRKGGELTGKPFSDTDIEILFADYLIHYGQHIAIDSRPFEGAREVLEALKQKNIPIAICTNKLEKLSRKLLEELDLISYFSEIIGADTLSVMKPDPETVHTILRKTKTSPDKALFIGDSETDLKTARAAGTPVVLVDFGYTTGPLHQLQPDRLVKSLKDIL